MTDETREDWDRGIARAERAHDDHDAFYNTANQSAIDAANAAVRTVFLINGGAALAMLTFLGTTVSAKQQSQFDLSGLVSSLQWFCWGIAVSGLASCLVYVSHRLIVEHVYWQEKHYEPPFMRDTKRSEAMRQAAYAVQAIAAAIVATALLLFLLGIYAALDAVPAQ